MSGILSKVMFVVALAVALAGVAVVGGLLWLRSPWGHEFVRGQIESRLDAAVHGSFSLGRVEGDVLTGLVLHDFVIRDDDTVYVTEAPFVQWQKALSAITTPLATAGSVNALVQ